MFDLTVLLLILIVILLLNFSPLIIYIELNVINLNHQTVRNEDDHSLLPFGITILSCSNRYVCIPRLTATNPAAWIKNAFNMLFPRCLSNYDSGIHNNHIGLA